ncbi:PIN domain-containing protein [Phytoactinopolyspora mesophila]|uniref:Ribonuclease VapC n=1 Tax=Phytoactinopolyspora mesophila TaxID=2650750 RepID=A0A7K3LXB6_9ACTN|nr:PIN domain-containing protein [Phytoactinopolyspora mesophila]
MTIVVDASFVVAALVDSGPAGTWAEQAMESEDLAAPHLMSVEAANILRRASQSGEISVDTASLAHADLLALSVVYFSYEPFGARVWELRDNVTSYDAWYVAVAEHLTAPMVTLDRKLAKASGVRCSFRVPPNYG